MEEMVIGEHTIVMGVINTTPDSFSDGGVHYDPSTAVNAALEMLQAGAEIIDVGGESTRPGSDYVDEAEEISRTIPVITGILEAAPHAWISIDTRRNNVAEKAIKAGARIINDVSGFRDDPGMIATAAAEGCYVIVMHMLGTPKTMQKEIVYTDFPADIYDFFVERIEKLQSSGISPDRIILDPGIGFGKTYDQNLILLNRVDFFKSLQKPLLIGPSRKAFLGRILDEPVPARRDQATMAAIAAAVVRGADIVRVHDVASAVSTCRVLDAILREKIEK